MDACQYEHLRQAGDNELAILLESDNLLRVLDMSEATQKSECELSCAHAIDPQCTATITIAGKTLAWATATSVDGPQHRLGLVFRRLTARGKK